MSKLKIAIALFGIPRGAQTTMPRLKEMIHAPELAFCEVKVFFHLFQQEKVVNSLSREDGFLYPADYAMFDEYEGELEPPNECLERWSFDKMRALFDPFADNYQSMSNLVHQLHSLWRVTARVEKFTPDIIIFARPDLLYHDSIPVSRFNLIQKNPTHCYIPDWQWWWGYNDRFALCGSHSYKIYGKRVERALEFCQLVQKGLHGERLLRYVLKTSNMSVRTISTRASRVRVDGRMEEENFSPDNSIGSPALLKELHELQALSQQILPKANLTWSALTKRSRA
jgi:hypothetical protein